MGHHPGTTTGETAIVHAASAASGVDSAGIIDGRDRPAGEASPGTRRRRAFGTLAFVLLCGVLVGVTMIGASTRLTSSVPIDLAPLAASGVVMPATPTDGVLTLVIPPG